MKTQDLYLRFVRWNDEDGLYVGYCPDLFPWGGVCHGEDEESTYHQLCVLVREEVELKAMAALQGKSIKDYVIERTLGAEEDTSAAVALKELEALLDERIRSAKKGPVSRRTVGEIFRNTYREPKGK